MTLFKPFFSGFFAKVVFAGPDRFAQGARMDAIATLEMLVRGGAIALLILLGVLFFRAGRGTPTGLLGMLFIVGTLSYVLASSPVIAVQLGGAILPFAVLATFNSVFLWWFATSLFDDEFRWRTWRLLPFVFLVLMVVLHRSDPDWAPRALRVGLHQSGVVLMMLHVLWLALSHRGDDLIEPRRQFRLIFAALIGATGLIIAAVEVGLTGIAPAWLTLFHASIMAAYTLGFCVWLMKPALLFEANPSETVAAGQGEGTVTAHEIGRSEPLTGALSATPDPATQHDLKRLRELMDAGAYREDGLTVGGLAAKMDLPEHQLRKLINSQLGYRNFTAFLNSYRLDEAKRLLTDPANARKQILQIALDLGYGSVGPFNRAFKSKTGQTPTEFRKESGGGSAR